MDITEHFRRYFLEDVRCAVVFATMDEFKRLPATGVKSLGMHDPVPFSDPPLCVILCVPWIEEITLGWEELDVVQYINILCFIGSELLLTFESEPDPQARFTAAEAKLFDHEPATRRVLKAAGLRAMDLMTSDQ